MKIKTVGPVTTAGYYRLLIPDLLSNLNQVLYIDDDIICKGDIAPLWNTKLSSNEWIGAVKDRCIQEVYSTNEDYRINIIEKYNLKGYYINSGMLLLNIKALRKNNIQEKWKQLIHKPLPFRLFNDQDIINPTCVGHVKFLDDKWNRFARLTTKNINAIIFLHYSGGIKPWNDPAASYYSYWKKYADITGYADNGHSLYVFGNSFTEQFIAQTDWWLNYHFINTEKDEWKKYFKRKFLRNKNNILIITHQAWNTGWNNILKKLRGGCNCYYYFLYNFDIRHSDKHSLIQKIFGKKIITYDKTDKDKYGLPFISFPARDMPTTYCKSPTVDWTFMAGGYTTDTHRFKNTYWLLKKLGNLPHRFVIDSAGLTDSSHDNIKFVIKNINFTTKGSIINDYEYSIVDTRCVCFIKQNGHEYFSPTIAWAIRNNKKILTDLNLIKTFPGYDPRWIRVIADFSKIDKQVGKWIKDDKIIPNYTHKEWFSPKQFVLDFKKLI